MSVTVCCPGCGKKLKVAEEKLGRQGRCPGCRTVFALTEDDGPADTAPVSRDTSAAAERPGRVERPSPTPTAAQWHVASHDGNDYGPISKEQLDEWVADGSVTEQCQLFREGDEEWRPAIDVYPQLSAADEIAGDAHLASGSGENANVWNVIDTVNLFHTGIGVCDWQIHLCQEGILAIPEGIGNTLRAGVAAGAGGLAAGHMVDGVVKGALGRGGEQQIHDAGEPKWMRFPLAKVERVVVQKKLLGGSRLFIKMKDRTEQKFATDNLGATHQARYVFGSIYKDLYREEKFKKPADRRKAAR